MATKFLSLSIAPKENKKKTVFTGVLKFDFEWEEGSVDMIGQPEDYDNVLCLGKYDDDKEDTYIFKVWDDDEPNSYSLYRGILGEEDYTSL